MEQHLASYPGSFLLQTKLDRLLDLQLEGSLSQTEYATKKYNLILVKEVFQEKISAFERKSKNRFELAIAFLKDATGLKLLVKGGYFGKGQQIDLGK